jgi:ATP-binding protein involved in chromosome partitioning
MSLTKDLVRQAFSGVPFQGSDLLALNAVEWTTACDTFASAKLHLPGNHDTLTMAALARKAHASLVSLASAQGTRVDSLTIEFVDHLGSVLYTSRFGTPASSPTSSPTPAPTPTPAPAPTPAGPAPVPQGHTPIGGLKQPTPQGKAGALPGVRHVIAVGAGKGGVGKSTVALNLAVGLARRGHAVGLLDGDIYGPSMPTMLGLHALDAVVHQGMLQPFLTHGVKCMTIGKLVDPDKPLIWRGPMAHGAFKQLTEQTQWGDLDYLIIDLPPGTGDVSLTMAQLLRLTGAVVVCTPQKVAQDDAVRAAKMFQQLGVEVLGVVENMSSFVGDDGKVYDIFGKGGAQTMAQRLNLPFLGDLPLTMSLRVNSDSGNPTANFTDPSPPGQRLHAALEALISTFENQVALASLRAGSKAPSLSIS